MLSFVLGSLLLIHTVDTQAPVPNSTPAVNAKVIDSETSPIPVYEHRQVYGLFGKNDAKIQISFKFQVIQKADFFVGYTQLNMWNIYDQSIPMRDLNYNPEFFYRFYFGDKKLEWLDLGFYEHESNGLDKSTSRAWDRSYLRYHGRVNPRADWDLFWNLKVWMPWRQDETSPDLANYRGIYEMEFTFKNILKPIFEADELGFRFFPGGSTYINPAAGGQELTFKGKIRWKRFLPYLVVQYFHGYGENMLDYNRSIHEVRAGIGY